MELIGQNAVETARHLPLETVVTRKAWSLLNGFGFDGYSYETLRCKQNMTLGVITRSDTVVNELEFGEDNRYGFSMSQYPATQSMRQVDPGWVALLMSEYDNDIEINEQQLAFRLETHPDGAAVYFSDKNRFERIKDMKRLQIVSGYLCMLEGLLWKRAQHDVHMKPSLFPVVEIVGDDLDLVRPAVDEE